MKNRFLTLLLFTYVLLSNQGLILESLHSTPSKDPYASTRFISTDYCPDIETFKRSLSCHLPDFYSVLPSFLTESFLKLPSMPGIALSDHLLTRQEYIDFLNFNPVSYLRGDPEGYLYFGAVADVIERTYEGSIFTYKINQYYDENRPILLPTCCAQHYVNWRETHHWLWLQLREIEDKIKNGITLYQQSNQRNIEKDELTSFFNPVIPVVDPINKVDHLQYILEYGNKLGTYFFSPSWEKENYVNNKSNYYLPSKEEMDSFNQSYPEIAGKCLMLPQPGNNMTYLRLAVRTSTMMQESNFSKQEENVLKIFEDPELAAEIIKSNLDAQCNDASDKNNGCMAIQYALAAEIFITETIFYRSISSLLDTKESEALSNTALKSIEKILNELKLEKSTQIELGEPVVEKVTQTMLSESTAEKGIQTGINKSIEKESIQTTLEDASTFEQAQVSSIFDSSSTLNNISRSPSKSLETDTYSFINNSEIHSFKENFNSYFDLDDDIFFFPDDSGIHALMKNSSYDFELDHIDLESDSSFINSENNSGFIDSESNSIMPNKYPNLHDNNTLSTIENPLPKFEKTSIDGSSRYYPPFSLLLFSTLVATTAGPDNKNIVLKASSVPEREKLQFSYSNATRKYLVDSFCIKIAQAIKHILYYSNISANNLY